MPYLFLAALAAFIWFTPARGEVRDQAVRLSATVVQTWREHEGLKDLRTRVRENVLEVFREQIHEAVDEHVR